MIHNQNYPEVVRDWLGFKEEITQDTAGSGMSCELDLLFAGADELIVKSEDFDRYRKAIVDALPKDQRPRKDRRNNLSAKSLNSYLEKLSVPYEISVKNKVWTIRRLSEKEKALRKNT